LYIDVRHVKVECDKRKVIEWNKVMLCVHIAHTHYAKSYVYITCTHFMAKVVMCTYCTYCKSYVHIPHTLIISKVVCTYCNTLYGKSYVHILYTLFIAIVVVHIMHILIISKVVLTYRTY